MTAMAIALLLSASLGPTPAPPSARAVMGASHEATPKRAEYTRDSGQTPAPAPAPPAPATQPAKPGTEAPPVPPPNYSYSPDGRRDPFMSLVNRGTGDARTSTSRGHTRPEGLPGLLVEEVVVRGIVQTRGGWVAMIGAPTGRTYTVRAGDRLMDGSVRSITPQAVILLQEVNDPLSLEKQREVRKYLRGEVK